MSVNRAKRFSVLARDGFRCRYCGTTADQSELEVDHIHPRSKGGSDDYDNLATACADCNQGKRDRILSDADRADESVRALRCVGGPLDGARYIMRGSWPLLWIIQMPDGRIIGYPTRWVPLPDYSERDPVLVDGHPGYAHEEARDGKTLGDYQCRGTNGRDRGEMDWQPVEALLVQLAGADWRGQT